MILNHPVLQITVFKSFVYMFLFLFRVSATLQSPSFSERFPFVTLSVFHVEFNMRRAPSSLIELRLVFRVAAPNWIRKRDSPKRNSRRC